MIEAGAVGATFEIVDLASAVLLRICDAFEELDGVIRQTKEALATFRLPPSVNTALAKLNENLALVGGSADKAATASTTAFGIIDKSIGTTAGLVADLKKEMATLAGSEAAVR
jgi:hypothetical protein